jgi:preprotein translocase subunit SecF
METNELEKKLYGPLNIIKYRWVYLGISLLLLIPGLFYMVLSSIEYPNHLPVRLGIDFVGGTIVEYGFERKMTQEDFPTIRHIFERHGQTGIIIQIQKPLEAHQQATDSGNPAGAPTKSADTLGEQAANKKFTINSVVSIRTKPVSDQVIKQTRQELQETFGNLTQLQKSSIGPTLANELLTNGLIALLFAYLLIVAYLTFRFQLDYAMCAIFALLHDSLFLIGFVSMLGYTHGMEVDGLFITALLTTVGFSVHDTIVVFDRMRENTRLLHSKKLPFSVITNISVNQTLRRSINTSVTALLTLLALYFLGGETIHDFVLVMLVGIAVGTYSSIFVASLVLAMWRERNNPEAFKVNLSATAA